MLSKQLLDILCCPVCRGVLKYDAEIPELQCLKCMLAYDIKDDIPVMLVDCARKISEKKDR